MSSYSISSLLNGAQESRGSGTSRETAIAGGSLIRVEDYLEPYYNAVSTWRDLALSVSRMFDLSGLPRAALLDPLRIVLLGERMFARRRAAAPSHDRALGRYFEHAGMVPALMPPTGKAPDALVAVGHTSYLRRVRTLAAVQSADGIVPVAVQSADCVCTSYVAPERPVAVSPAEPAYRLAPALVALAVEPSAHSLYTVPIVRAQPAAEPSADCCRAAAVVAPSTIAGHELAKESHRKCLIVDGKALGAG